MGTAISCTKCSQVAGFVDRAGRSSSNVAPICVQLSMIPHRSPHVYFVVDLNLWHIKCTIACIHSLPLLFQQMMEEHVTKTVIPFERADETFRSKDIHVVPLFSLLHMHCNFICRVIHPA